MFIVFLRKKCILKFFICSCFKGGDNCKCKNFIEIFKFLKMGGNRFCKRKLLSNCLLIFFIVRFGIFWKFIFNLSMFGKDGGN